MIDIYGQYLDNIWSDFAKQFLLNDKYEPNKKVFQDTLIDTIRESFALSTYDGFSDKVWYFQDFNNDISQRLIEIDSLRTEKTSKKEFEKFFDMKKYAELVFNEVYDGIRAEMQSKIYLSFEATHQNKNNELKIEIKQIKEINENNGTHFEIKEDLGVKQFVLNDEKITEKRTINDRVIEEFNSKYHSIFNKDVEKVIIQSLNKVEEKNQSNNKWDILETNSEGGTMRYSNDEYFEVDDAKRDDEHFFVSANTTSAKLKYLPGENRDFDGRLLDLDIDIDEYAKKYNVKGYELAEILLQLEDSILNDLWNKSTSDNLFDSMDDFLKENNLNGEFAVMSYKGKYFEVIPLYQEKEYVYENYCDDLVKYEFNKNLQNKQKIIDFLENKKQEIYNSIKEVFETYLNDNYQLNNESNNQNFTRRK